MSVAPTSVVELRHSEVDPRLRTFQAGEEVDSFVVVCERFVLFLDTLSTPALMRQLTRQVRPLLAGRPVLVLNTHADWDHVYGNALFTAGGELPGVIVASELTRERLLSPEARARLVAQQAEDDRFAGVTLVPPDLSFRGTLTLHGGDLTLEVFPTPGHTPDHVSVWIPELRTLLAGDAAEFPFPHVSEGAQLPILRASLERMAALQPGVVLPCHGGTTTPALLEQNLAYFELLQRRAAELGDPVGWLDRPAEAAAELGLTYETILADLGTSSASTPEFYRAFHQDAMRATLQLLSGASGGPDQG